MTACLSNLHYSNYDKERFQNISDYIKGAITDLNEISKKRLKACLDRRSYYKEHTELSSGLTDDISRDSSPNKPDMTYEDSIIKYERRMLLKSGYFQLNSMAKDNSRIAREIAKLHEIRQKSLQDNK